jgi:hypothetical protein
MKRTTTNATRPKWRAKGSPGDQLRRAADRAQVKAGCALEHPLVRALVELVR